VFIDATGNELYPISIPTLFVKLFQTVLKSPTAVRTKMKIALDEVDELETRH
jgi:hypothetical protein